ncbi:MAG TPA: MFS transporter [Polyangia bacterium]|nr:MFS transporter [Polyangia bacterium]
MPARQRASRACRRPDGNVRSCIRPGALLRSLVQVRDHEVRSLLWAFLYAFALLCGYYVLRPVREEMGIARGAEQLPWFFLGTFVATLAAVPLYSWVVARKPRRRIVPVVYHFAAANLLLFWVLLRFGLVPRPALAPVFFVWLSVFNLFVVSVFWSLMADLFTPEQGKRLFGFIAAGGSAGGLLGPLVAAFLTRRIGQAQLLLLAATLVELAVVCVSQLAHPRTQRHAQAPIGGGIWAGFVGVARSRFLQGIAGQTLATTVTATFLYLQQARIVQAAALDPATRTMLFARIDLCVNLVALLVQAAGTGRLLARAGLAVGLSVTPLCNALGCAALALAPRFGVLMAVQAVRRAAHYAVERPSREVLFTVVPDEDKYKAKSFLDTFVYRGGDLLGSWAFRGLGALGLAIRGTALAAIPLSAAWLVLVLFLARRATLSAHEAPGVSPDRGAGGREPAAPVA